MKLYNDRNDHFLCHYTLVMDSFSKFCDIGCVYCYAKDFGPEQRTAISLKNLEKEFINAFDKEEKGGLSEILRKKIPIRLGFETDPFQDLEKKTNITYSVLKLFKKYHYPYIIFTKSDLCLEEKYRELYDPDLTYIQVSVSSPLKEISKRIEPLAKPAEQRADIVKILEAWGIESALRFNLLPRELHQMEDAQYFKDCLEFIKKAKVKKLILNKITLTKDRERIQFPLSLEDFSKIQEENSEHTTVSLCYLGSSAVDYYTFKNEQCDNCCQCDLKSRSKTTDLSIFLSPHEGMKNRLEHVVRMGMLKTLKFTLKNGVS